MRPQRDLRKAPADGPKNTGPLRTAGDVASPQILPSATHAELSNDNLRLRETPNNLTHGVVMFDESAKIVVCNDRYIEMYGLSKDVVKPGCTFLAMIKHRKQVGVFAGDVQKHCKKALERVKRGQTSDVYHLTADGPNAIPGTVLDYSLGVAGPSGSAPAATGFAIGTAVPEQMMLFVGDSGSNRGGDLMPTTGRPSRFSVRYRMKVK